MHTRNTLLTATACLAVATNAYALFPVLGGEVGVALNTSWGYDSNINANSGEQGDDVLTVTPSLDWTRSQGINHLTISTGFSIVRYGSTGNVNDSINPNFTATLSGPNGVSSNLTYNLGFSFFRSTDANDLVGQITDIYNYDFTTNFTYQVNEKWGVGLAPSIQYQDYRTAGFADILSTAIATSLQYSYSEKLTLDGGYRFRYQYVPSSSSGPTSESIDHTLFIGAFGVLAPKVTGNVQTGISYRDWLKPSTQDNFVYPYVNAGVSWAYSQKTTFTANAGVDLGQSPANQGLETAYAGIGVSHMFTDQFSGGLNFDYIHSFFTGPTNRSDNAYVIGGNFEYIINSWASAGLTASYQWNDSDVSTFQYNRWNVFGNVNIHF
ncbi:outer membrane beta-barrel protein [Cerasicoccus maritimus]|uniref:outer membrane beta-barrel protein n=1 Tax=Cerasicoccus maritimus TaxID=490089 RepID=UPI002852AD1F|nr:outer membrane beta-barrel protein [Cerasicoccus maritimus]